MTDRWPLVVVRWVDSHGFHGWRTLGTIKETYSLECVSIGWLVTDDADRISLISSIQGLDEIDPQCAGHVTIPRQAVLEIRNLTWSEHA